MVAQNEKLSKPAVDRLKKGTMPGLYHASSKACVDLGNLATAKATNPLSIMHHNKLVKDPTPAFMASLFRPFAILSPGVLLVEVASWSRLSLISRLTSHSFLPSKLTRL